MHKVTATLGPRVGLHVVAGCQHYLNRFTWRHDSILKVLAKTFQAVRNCTLLVDLPGFESPSTVTGDEYRPDLLLTTSDKRLYIIELTVGHESNLAKNVNRKKAKYKDLIRQLGDKNFSTVKFVNLSMSSLGVFDKECHTLLEMLKDLRLDKRHQQYCIKKMISTAIRSTYYIFCCRNKEWSTPELMNV